MSYLGNQVVSGAIQVEYFSGTGAQTSFPLSYAMGTESSLLVTISGVKQQAASYTILNGALTFSTAPASGTNNIEVVYLGGGILMTGVNQFGDGTQALPSISHLGNSNTGMWFPDDNVVAVSTGGTERLRVGANGQIGLSGENYGTAGQVLTSNASNAAVWSTIASISLADGSVTTAKLADSSVTAAKIASGAVANTTITGNIESSQIASSGRHSSGDISGLTVSNNGSTNTKFLDIQAGKCRNRAHSWAFTVDTGSTLTTNLLGYWKLNEASGIRKDSYNWSDTVAVRAAPVSANGKVSSSALFTRTNSEGLQVPVNANLKPTGSYSIAGWVMGTTLPGAYNAIVWSMSGAASYFDSRLYHNGTSGRWEALYINSTGTQYFVTANTFGALSIYTWYFIVVTYNDSTKDFKISVNNGAFDTTVASGTVPTDQTVLTFGMNHSHNGNYFDGRICEFGLWSKVLSTQEITDLYNSGNGNTLTETISDSITIDCSAMTEKKLNVAWSAGSTGGLLDTGSILASNTYHIFAISKTDGTQDYVASLNPKKPTLPTGYTYYRRIRSVRTDGSSNIYKETQNGNKIIFETSIRDLNITTESSSAKANAETFSVPSGISVVPLWAISCTTNTSGGETWLYSDFDMTDAQPTNGGAAPGATIRIDYTNYTSAMQMSGLLATTTSRQCRVRPQSGGRTQGRMTYTYGYIDPNILGAGR